MSKKAVVKIGADVEEAKKGINKITDQLNQMSKSTKNSSVSKFFNSFSAFGKSVEFATSAIKKANEAIKENIELAQKQQKAEVQLQAAAKNNPYLTDASVVQLKNYASQLQSISTIGDEELLPMMSQLASAGRTQTEIQDIMSAALDLSASGMMSMDAAVSALNGTLQGNVGTLGKQISGIKELTTEELKSGKAIEIIKQQFDGMSESISEQTGGWQKYKNSLGDFKEVLGTGWANLQNSVGNTLSSFFDSITSKLKIAKDKAEEFKAELNLIATNDSDKGTVATLQSEIDLLEAQNKQYEAQRDALTTTKKDFIQGEKDKQKELEETKRKLDALLDEYYAENYDGSSYRTQQEEFAYSKLLEERFTKLHPEFATIDEDLEKQKLAVKNAGKEWETLQEQAFNSGNSLESLTERIDDNNKRLGDLNTKLSEAKKNADLQAEGEAAKTLEQKAAEAKKNYEAAINAYDLQILKQRELGKEISEEEEIRGRINVMQQGLFDLVEKSEGAISWNNSQLKDEYIPNIQALYEKLQKLADANAEVAKNTKDAEEAQKKLDEQLKKCTDDAQKLIDEANDYIGNGKGNTLSSQIENEISLIEEEQKAFASNAKAYSQLVNKKTELEGLLTKVKEEEIKKQKQLEEEHIAEVASNIAEYADRFAEITQGVTDLIRQNNEQQTQEELTELSEQYTDGIISYEEYCEKKKEIDKKAAREEYKLKMWEWSASLIQATANIAEGVAKAIAQGGVAGIITGALVAASGAVQIATITANKPKAPSFATGGIVQGNSYSGDRIQANVNSGEMILNAQQQRNLWEAANRNGGGGASINMPVKIINNASDQVSAKAGLTPDGFEVLIEQVVNSKMAAGKFNDSMDIAKNRRAGFEYQ